MALSLRKKEQSHLIPIKITYKIILIL